MIACGCPSARMCDRCVADSFAQLRGVAACRGEVWAMAVAQRWSRTEPWPATERATAIAQRKIADLTRDPRLADLLVRELIRWAARWWEAQRERRATSIETDSRRIAAW